MKNKLFLLIKTNFRQLFSGAGTVYEGKNNGKKRKSTIILFVFLGVYFAAMSTFMTYELYKALDEVGLKIIIPCFCFISCTLLTFITGLFSSQAFLFKAKDLDMLFSFPISHSTVLISKFFTLYIYELLFSFLTIGLSSIVYFVLDGVTFSSLITVVFGILLTPMFPISLGCILSYFSGLAIRRVKNKNAITTAITVVLSLGFITLVYMADFNKIIEYILANGGEIYDKLTELYFPVGFYMASFQGELLYIALFILVNILPISFVLWIITKKYAFLSASLKQTSQNKDYVFTSAKKEEKKSSIFIGCLKKEIKRVFSSSAYILNCGSGILVLIMLVITFSRRSDSPIMEEMSFLLCFVLLFALLIAATLTTTTTCTISLEAKTLWIYKSSPVDISTVLRAKAAVNMLIYIPVLTVFSIVISVISGIGGKYIPFLIVVPAIASVFSSYLGLIMNLALPKFNWTNEVQAIKQGASVIACMGITMGANILIGVGSFFLTKIFDFYYVLIAITVVYAIAAYIIRYVALTWGVKRFNLLY